MILDTHRQRILSETRWAGLAGNEKAIRTVRALVEDAARTGDPLVLFLAGKSGIGKSLTAALAAQEYGVDTKWVLHTIASGDCNKPRLRKVSDDWGLTPYMGRGHGLLIEELDTATDDALGYLLSMTEGMPKWRIVICTTNLTELQFCALPHGSALHRRGHFIAYTTEGLAERKGKPGPGAELVRAVLHDAGLDGHDAQYYVRFVREAHGNLGDAILRAQRAALATD